MEKILEDVELREKPSSSIRPQIVRKFVLFILFLLINA